jgi:ribosomal protein S14
MLAKKFKDLKLRKLFLKNEVKKKINKFLFIYFLSKKIKTTFIIKRFLSQKRISKTKLSPRCVFTNRNRGFIRAYSISRTYLRELMQFGIIPGIKKAVW